MLYSFLFTIRYHDCKSLQIILKDPLSSLSYYFLKLDEIFKIIICTSFKCQLKSLDLILKRSWLLPFKK